MRFDDRLSTVLAADMGSVSGAQAAWRQLVDLIGRGRVAADGPILARLRALRPTVPVEVRTASARALAHAAPAATLVELFAEDELAVAAPVLRTAVLREDEWPTLIERSTPAGRAVLRQRRDLPAGAVRALESFGSIDFALPYHAAAAGQAAIEPIAVVPTAIVPTAVEPTAVMVEVAAPVAAALVVPSPAALAPPSLSPSPFVAFGEVTRALPVVAEALRRAGETSAPAAGSGTFVIADLVARIDAFQRDRDTGAPLPRPEREVTGFRFETDAAGVIRAVEGASRAALVGVSLAYSVVQGLAQVDAAVAGAVRQRDRFAEARLEIGGTSALAGAWRIAGVPAFDPVSGRFVGYAGVARRPLRHETAALARQGVSDSLRQLVHELRTPANAVAGFAELIESELLGPVAEIYRDRATAIRTQAADLLAAIDDLDIAARIEGGALDLRPGPVAMAALVERVARDLGPLAAQRQAVLTVDGDAASAEVDDRAAERLVARLLAALLSAATPGERIAATLRGEGMSVALVATRPRALADLSGDALFALDDGEPVEGGPLLGAGFTLRLVRNLAAELGGTLTIGTDRLTLRLPAALDLPAEQVSIS